MMLLTIRERAAIISLVDLASHQLDGLVALSEISRRVDLSMSYLEQIFGKLRCSGLVTGLRGPGGGYSLARSVHEITVADIILAVEKAQTVNPRSGKGCDPYVCHDDDAARVAHLLFLDLNSKAMEFLDAITLEDLIDGSYASKQPSSW